VKTVPRWTVQVSGWGWLGPGNTTYTEEDEAYQFPSREAAQVAIDQYLTDYGHTRPVFVIQEIWLEMEGAS
jgi:hypothetical protein